MRVWWPWVVGLLGFGSFLGVCCGLCCVAVLFVSVLCLWLLSGGALWELASCIVAVLSILARDPSRRCLWGSFVAAPKPGGQDQSQGCPVLFVCLFPLCCCAVSVKDPIWISRIPSGYRENHVRRGEAFDTKHEL